MNLEGLEMVAVLVVLALFVKVLEQFGLFEPVSLEGNPCLGRSGLLAGGTATSSTGERLTLTFLTGGRGEQVSIGIGYLGEVRRGAWGTRHLGEVKRGT